MTIDTIPPRSGLPRPVQVAALRAAVSSQTSWRGVMRCLGLTTSRTGRVLRDICDEIGIDYGHFRVIGPDDASLLRVVPAAGSWSEALGQLGYSPDSGSARATVRKHCQRLGVDTSHLRLPRVATPASHLMFTPRPDRHLRAAGPYLVAAALTLAGHTVSWAGEGAVYDLLVDICGVGIRRVQVKTGTQRTAGGWIVTLKRTEYGLGGHGRACYSSEDVDYFGCVDGEGQIYLCADHGGRGSDVNQHAPVRRVPPAATPCC